MVKDLLLSPFKICKQTKIEKQTNCCLFVDLIRKEELKTKKSINRKLSQVNNNNNIFFSIN